LCCTTSRANGLLFIRFGTGLNGKSHERVARHTALLAIMSRLTKIAPDEASPEARAVFDDFLKERGNVPNMFRTIAHRPDILRTMTAHFRAVMNTGTVDKKLKEMVAVRVSHINHCDY
jgi:alkylhydroperoxidase family enzyme